MTKTQIYQFNPRYPFLDELFEIDSMNLLLEEGLAEKGSHYNGLEKNIVVGPA